MGFVPKNDLERQLVRAAEDPLHRAEFLRAFLDAEIYVADYAAPLPARNERRTLVVGEQIGLRPIDVDGVEHLPMFTSLRLLEEFVQTEVAFLRLQARPFLEMTRGAHAVLNPGADYGKLFTPEEIASLLDGTSDAPLERRVVEAETEVYLGEPAEHPHELVDALTRLYRKRRYVRRAWLALYHDPQRDEQPCTLIGLEIDGDWDTASRETGEIINNVAIPNPPVDLMQVSGGDGVQQYFLRDARPFYKRKTLGLF